MSIEHRIEAWISCHDIHKIISDTNILNPHEARYITIYFYKSKVVFVASDSNKYYVRSIPGQSHILWSNPNTPRSDSEPMGHIVLNKAELKKVVEQCPKQGYFAFECKPDLAIRLYIDRQAGFFFINNQEDIQPLESKRQNVIKCVEIDAGDFKEITQRLRKTANKSHLQNAITLSSFEIGNKCYAMRLAIMEAPHLAEVARGIRVSYPFSITTDWNTINLILSLLVSHSTICISSCEEGLLFEMGESRLLVQRSIKYQEALAV